LRARKFKKRWPALDVELRRIRDQDEEPKSEGWRAMVPEPSKSELETLSRLRQEIRDKAAGALGRALARTPKEVRVNVFFLSTARARAGILELRMAEELRPGIAEGETAVFFRQNQGLTGHAFQHRCPFAAWGRSAPGGRDWQLTDFGAGYEHRDAALNIGDTRQKALHQEMRWILSLPLKDGEKSWPLGVLNIDGFDRLPEPRGEAEKIFRSLRRAVEGDLTNFRNLLRKSPSTRLRLAVE
jgi:hypothetical protein